MHRPFLSIAALFAVTLFTGCTSVQNKSEAAGESKPATRGGVDLSFLLSMDFDEAAAISAQRSAVAPFVKVAADEIQVLRTDEAGRPRKLRAKGHVFVQLDYSTQARALCHEALISDEDVILRGNPLLQRGGSTVEGVSDVTVFYLMGSRLRAIGPHKVSNANGPVFGAPVLAAWQSGPNPLLPPLQATDVPDSVRGELKKAAEAEAALQKSRVGQPMAFPESLSKPVPAP